MSNEVIMSSAKLVNLANAVRAHASVSDKLKLLDIPGMIKKEDPEDFVGTYQLADGICFWSDGTERDIYIGVKSKKDKAAASVLNAQRMSKVYSGTGTLLHNETVSEMDGGGIFVNRVKPVNWEAFKETGARNYDSTIAAEPDSEGYYTYAFYLYPGATTIESLYYNGGDWCHNDMTAANKAAIDNQLAGGYVEFI